MPRYEITRDDLMNLADYVNIRKQKRHELSIIKKNRRVEIVRTLLLGTHDDHSPLRYLRGHSHLNEVIFRHLSELFLAVQPEHTICKRHSHF